MLPAIILLLGLLNPPQLEPRNFAIFGYEKGFVFLTKDSLHYTTDGEHFDSRSHRFNLDMYRMKPVKNVEGTNRRFLIAAGGGLVYKFERDTLFRIDNSYLWRSRYGSSSLAHEDSIISFGGYGEFNYSNKGILFKESFREWSVIPMETPEPPPLGQALIQLDTIDKALYLGMGYSNHFDNEVEVIQQSDELLKLDLRSFKYSSLGNFGFVKERIFGDERALRFGIKSFEDYQSPMLYGRDGIWSFDLINMKAYEHIKADYQRLNQYSEILAYNSFTHEFLLGSDMASESARYHVVNEIDLLGLFYKEYSLANSKMPFWAYGLFGVSLLLLIPLFRTRTFVGLDQAIIKEERKIQQQLSSEDFFILKRIVEAFPEYVEYPELQNSYEKDLSYESRIKKLRASIKEIDEVVQKTIGRKRSSIFEIEKGREDKRIKVIRIKDDNLKKTDFFGRLRRGSK